MQKLKPIWDLIILIQLWPGHSHLQAFYHLLCDQHRVDVARVETLAKVSKALGDVVKLHLLKCWAYGLLLCGSLTLG